MGIRAATLKDIPAILNLQQKNLYINIETHKLAQGFVTTPFTIKQLEKLITNKGLFIAEEELTSELLGYIVAASWDYFTEWSIFPFMIKRLEGKKYLSYQITKDNSFQYGPICVDNKKRGTDCFRRLFEYMRMEMSEKYPIGLTFINKMNKRSFAAHTRKLAMGVLDEFEFKGLDGNSQFYYSLAFDTQKAVL